MKKHSQLRSLPGWIASLLMIFFSTYWTYWGANEMYHEGWWGAWYHPLPYLIPIAATLLPTLAAMRWPLAGGITIVGAGVFTFFFFSGDVSWIGLAIALVGVAFIFDGILKRRSPAAAQVPPIPWWKRNWLYRLAFGLPLLVFILVSANMLPVVLTRVDDGDRSARLIEGNGVDLIWAPEGPGWNWEQPYGGYPSWQALALYGLAPIGMQDKPGYGRQADGTVVFAGEAEMNEYGLCAYLSADGTTLMDEPQNIWRLPNTDELVRSLVRHGENAGCTWQGEFRTQAACAATPDKESPLWSTDVPVIYYLSAESYSDNLAYFVAYNGSVNATYKLGGNPRHGYRCVREP
jgi:hypothetical protein